MNDERNLTRLPVMHREHRSLFMELPTEVRENILRYLLVASYTSTEHNVRSKEYNANRYHLLRCSDQAYHFHPSTMMTNRRIYEESVNLLERENEFVCLTTSRHYTLFEYVFGFRMNMIACGAKADRFPYAAMKLTVDPLVPVVSPFRRWCDSADDQPCRYIFCLDELPIFCRLLLKEFGKHSKCISLRSTAIHININTTWKEQTLEMDCSVSGLLRLHKLLDPLRQLHSFGAAQIEGPLSANYKSSMIADLCKECPNAMDVIGTTTEMLGQGDELDRQGLVVDAINKYRTALDYVRSCCWIYDEQDFVLDSGLFPGLTAKQTMQNLKVRLLARLASIYFQNKKLRMARIYVDRALDPQPDDDCHYRSLWRLDRRPWQQVVYAEVLHVSARIWYTYGRIPDAIQAVRNAQEYVELNDEQQSTLEAWQRHEDAQQERRTKARETRLQKERSNDEAKFLVICNGKKKGDRLLKRGRSELAISTYRTTLSKMEVLNQILCWKIPSDTFGGYYILDRINALRFKVQASMAASYLKSRRFADVIKCTDDILRCNYDPLSCRHNGSDYYTHKYWGWGHDWATDQRLDYAKAYYCNSIALMRVGETVRAVERMEKALEFDPEDSGISAQLMILKRQAEKEKS